MKDEDMPEGWKKMNRMKFDGNDLQTSLTLMREMAAALELYADYLPGICTHEMPKGMSCAVLHTGGPNRAMQALKKFKEWK